jgi:hypothetical protein
MEYKSPEILIDITMTAVRRPDILKRTLNSFFRNIFAPIIDRCRLVVNIDPIGDDIASHELCKIFSAYFKHYMVNMPMESSFPRAFRWTWTRSDAPWVFHLEDDWELMESIDIKFMIEMMEKFPQLASLRLPFFHSATTTMKNWNLFFPWNGFYFECPPNLRKTAGFAGHPSLIRGEYVKRCAPLIDIKLNPEKQFHGGNEPLLNEVMRWEYGVWGKPNSQRMIKDIGIEWRNANRFQKKGSKAFFTEWEKTS